ncbi:MAG: hypothetical protein JW742_08065 [Candidatus Aminicenantes bacterium]|nr:hypothetical protein [Candidatus Aminicenantes bacterium]
MTSRSLRILASLLALTGLFASAGSAQSVEWTLKVAADSAVIRSRPDAAAPALAAAAKGTILKSYAREGDWFRVLADPGRGGFVVLGYIAAADVAVEAEAGPPPEVWKRIAGEFLGAGLSLRIGFGPAVFGGGDFETGCAGLYDRTTELAESYGAVIEDFEKEAIASSLRLGADLVYRLTPRWGCGLRVAYERASPQSYVRVHYGGGLQTTTAISTVGISVLTVRPGVYYEQPLGRAWSLEAHAGPAFHLVDFEYGRDLVHPAGEDGVSIVADGRGFGLEGGLGLEWRFHRRYALFAEAQGRLANIGGFEGDEVRAWSINYQSWTTKTTGPVYLEEDGQRPRLIVLEDGSAAGGGAREAKMNLSGFGIAAGFRVRF